MPEAVTELLPHPWAKGGVAFFKPWQLTTAQPGGHVWNGDLGILQHLAISLNKVHGDLGGMSTHEDAIGI